MKCLLVLFHNTEQCFAAVLKFKTWMLFADAGPQIQDYDNNVEHRHHVFEQHAEILSKVFEPSAESGDTWRS